MTILIVDNDKWVLNGLSKLIGMMECDVETVLFSSSTEALDYALKKKPMLIIADVEMPEMNGLEFCRKLGEAYRPHIIIISGFDKFQYAQEAIQIGVSNYVLKPINQGEFMTLICSELQAIQQEQSEQKMLNLNIRNGFFESLYIGKDTGAFIQKFVGLYGKQMEEESYTFVYAVVDDFSAMKKVVQTQYKEKSKGYTALIAYIENNCPDKIICSELRHGSVAFCIIGNTNPFLEWIRTLIFTSREYDCQITIGVSLSSTRLDCLLEQFRQAIEALQDKFFHGQNEIYLYKRRTAEITKETTKSFLLVHNYADRISDILFNSNNREEIHSAADELICELIKMSYSREEIVLFFQELVLLTTSRLVRISDSRVDAGEINMPDNIFGMCDTLQEIETIFLEYITSLYGNAQKQMVRNVDSIQYVTDKMLEEDCANVSLDSIAERCNIHRNYLSIMFKEKVGMNFKDYVLGYKIKRAKHLLRGSNVRMSVIAEELGYMDVKNFSRAFKTYTGQSPSEYRNQEKDKGI
ncbi:response regulator [Blautia schinkii]|nr:response regulator [Blautia schinkii]